MQEDYWFKEFKKMESERDKFRSDLAKARVLLDRYVKSHMKNGHDPDLCWGDTCDLCHNTMALLRNLVLVPTYREVVEDVYRMDIKPNHGSPFWIIKEKARRALAAEKGGQ